MGLVSGCFSGSFRCLAVFSCVDAWLSMVPRNCFFGSYREWMVGADWMAFFLIPLFFTSLLTKNSEKREGLGFLSFASAIEFLFIT